ncbi:MAG: DUF4834 family protein [Bacteroidia bacterium]|jgi:hypothetical protein|nr:DUF4834 family protein [Bacteroidia bacterium]
MILFILVNIVSFFDLLVILFVLYYGFKFFMRFIAPRVVDNAANKIYQDMQNKAAAEQERKVRKGDMTIEYSNRRQKQFGRKEGDYIEFEEIDDKK